MARVPTPVPKSIARSAKRLFSGTVLDVLWKLFVIAALLTAVALMAYSGGFFLAFLAGAILSALVTDDITQFVRDVWHRNFWIWRV